MPELTLDLITNDGALWGMLAQDGLNRELDALLGADRRFDIDLAAPSLTFGSGSTEVSAIPHLIASVAPGPRTVRWAWALPELAQLPACSLSTRLREFGAAQRIAQLVEEEVPFDAFGSTGGAEVPAVAEQVGIVASQIIGEVPWFSAPAGESRAVVLLQNGPRLPEPTLGDLMAVLPDALTNGRIVDPPRAIRHLLDKIPAWQGEWGPAGVRITDGQGTVDVHLDDAGQVVEIQSNL